MILRHFFALLFIFNYFCIDLQYKNFIDNNPIGRFKYELILFRQWVIYIIL